MRWESMIRPRCANGIFRADLVQTSGGQTQQEWRPPLRMTLAWSDFSLSKGQVRAGLVITICLAQVQRHHARRTGPAQVALETHCWRLILAFSLLSRASAWNFRILVRRGVLSCVLLYGYTIDTERCKTWTHFLPNASVVDAHGEEMVWSWRSFASPPSSPSRNDMRQWFIISSSSSSSSS